MTLRLITPPSQTPVTVEQTKAYLKIEDSTQVIDDMVETMIYAATSVVENYCSISVMPQVWELKLPSLEETEVALPRPPLMVGTPLAPSIVSFKYSLSGTLYDVPTTVYTADSTYCTVRLNSGQAWPSGEYYLIRYNAGYPLNSVPTPICQAVLDLVTYKYQNLDNQNIPRPLLDQVDSYRVYSV